MIKQNKLLIDRECPMCQLYGNSFVKIGLIDEDSIFAYQDVPIETQMEIDFERAKDEIAMHDPTSGDTTYGLQSILKIITQKNPRWEKVLHSNLVFHPLNILYRFISFNRKVIAPSSLSASSSRLCEPSLNLSYRWAYIFFVAIVTGFIVNAFTAKLFPHLGWAHSIHTEIMICFGQVAWQGMATLILLKENRLNYLGNMSTVSMIGGMLLLPIVIGLSFIEVGLFVKMLLFFGVVSIMFFEHIRRCKLLDVTLWMTVSWVTFRVVSLSILILSKEIL